MEQHGYDTRGYALFKDDNPQTLSKGQVWSIRESLMRPVAEFIKKHDLALVRRDMCSAKSRDTSVRSWLHFHRCKEGPRPCVVRSFGRAGDEAWLMGTLNNGQIADLSLIVDMFFVQVDPAPTDMTPSEQHVHAGPRWCQEKKQYICVLSTEHKGVRPAGFEGEDQGYLLERWVERYGSPEEKGQRYGFSQHQLNRLNTLNVARCEQWRNISTTEKEKAIKHFRQFVNRHQLDYGAEDLPPGSFRSRAIPSLWSGRSGRRSGLSALSNLGHGHDRRRRNSRPSLRR
ncbi:unnamed protein product [Peniophora sp. CBMAI 1063]|nr:unnamed protein product [Peniophora sp. CBMAI 1063]